MLNNMRAFARTFVSFIFVGLLVISFAIWGVGDIFSARSNTAVAKVGDVDVPGQIFENEFRTYVRRLQQQIPDFTSEQARAIGVDRQVLDGLVSRTLIDVEAQELGLRAGDAMVRDLLEAEAIFRGVDGNFSADRYRQILSANGLSPVEYEESLRQEAVRTQLTEAMASLGAVPQSLAQALMSFERETRQARYIEIGRGSLAPIADPEDAVLESYLQNRQAQFREPERRDLVAVVVDPEAFLDQVDVAEETIRAAYDADSALYTRPAERMLDQLLFKTREQAEAARARIAAGSAFEQIAGSEDFPGVTLAPLGTVTQSELIDQTVAGAAFAIPVPGVSSVVEGEFGFVIVRATEETPAVVTEYETVREKILRDLSLDNAVDLAFAAANAFEEERAAGTSLEDAAADAGLEVLRAEGVAAGGAGAPETLPANEEFWSEVFFAATGEPSALLEVGERGYAAFRVLSVSPARDKTLEEVREDVLAAWRTQERQRALMALAEETAQSLRDGERFESAARRLKTRVRETGSIARDADPKGLGQAGLARIFAALPQTIVTSAGREEGKAVVAQVTAVEAPDLSAAPEEVQEFATQLRDQMAQDLGQSYLNALRTEHGVTINETLVERILGGGYQG